MKVSILMPVYNEESTLKKILKKINEADIGGVKKEIVIIDDGSTDKTIQILNNLKQDNIKIYYNKNNKGKGYSIKKAIRKASGNIIIFQDADLEYDPNDYKKLLDSIIHGDNDVVYGSRFLKGNIKGKISFYLGNKILSLITSMLYFSRITDMETCYKVFKKDIIKNIKIKSNDFAIEPEITSRILKQNIKIKEVSISYYPRTFNQGKKIKWKDGLIALKTLVYYRFFN